MTIRDRLVKRAEDQILGWPASDFYEDWIDSTLRQIARQVVDATLDELGWDKAERYCWECSGPERDPDMGSEGHYHPTMGFHEFEPYARLIREDPTE